MTHRSHTMRGRIFEATPPSRLLPAVLLGCLLAGTLTACSSGDGGDNGGVGSPDTGTDVGANNPNQPAGLVFSYPVNGQTDVYPGTTIAFAFSGDASGDVQLVDTQTGQALPANVVNQGNGIYNIYPADSDAQMAPATTYAVVADGNIGDDDNTSFASGDTLFAFTTAAAGGAATSADFTLVNFPMGNDAGFPIAGESFPFTQFNTLRARFSQPVDEGSVKLCTDGETLGTNNCTVAVTGPDGNVNGRLYVLGKDFVFDPGAPGGAPRSDDASDYAGDLAANTTYTVNFSDDFVSASGQSLTSTDSFSVTPLGITTGDRGDVVQRLTIAPTASDGISPVSGRAANNIDLASQLIGSYDLAAVPSPDQGGLRVRLAAFNGDRFGGKIPTVLPRGQRFNLKNLNLALGSQSNGDGTFTEGEIDTPVNLDTLNAQFASDSDVYLLANSLRNVEGPTRVTQRLDLNIFGEVPQGSPIAALSNGVVNQTALNVLASGIAVPQENGDIALTLYGALPISVNRDAKAAANFELELTLAASVDDQPEIVADMTSPRITAQYPSACEYVFNTFADTGNTRLVDSGQEDDEDTPEDESQREVSVTRFLFDNGNILGGVSGTTSLSTIESNCVDLMSQRLVINAGEEPIGQFEEDDLNRDATLNFPNPWANSLPLGAKPSIVFSEAVDPASVQDQITLMQADGSAVPSRSTAQGSSVVVTPLQRLQPDSKYTLQIQPGITDLAGNLVTNTTFPGGSTLSRVTFTTEPMVVPYEDGVPRDIDLDESEAVRQTAPFLTALTPGMPCALQTVDQFNSTNRASDDDIDSGDYFRNGGDIAGRCVGDRPSDTQRLENLVLDEVELFPGVVLPTNIIGDPDNIVNSSNQVVYNVFDHSANQNIEGYFSKPVRADTVTLANGCLIGGSSSASSGTIAVQIMEGNTCTGTVDGTLSTLTPGSPLTRGFKFTPASNLAVGQRYWTVVCGSNDPAEDAIADTPSACSSGQTVIGQNGLALNTTPLRNSGGQISGPPQRQPDGTFACDGNTVPTGGVLCFTESRAEGGEDIVMPFDAVAATANYVSITRSLPETDTNGNGFFENTIGATDRNNPPNLPFPTTSGMPNYILGGFNSGEDRVQQVTGAVFNESVGSGRERAQFSNAVNVRTLGQDDPDTDRTTEGGDIPTVEALFLSGTRPIVVEPSTTGASCSPATQVRFSDGRSVLSGTPSSCIPVALPPSGLTVLTSAQANGFLNTGRVFLRFPEVSDSAGNQRVQRGYIVPSCQGTLPRSGDSFEYAPCFVGDLTLTANAPDILDVAVFPQQDINVQVFGPVAFEQNGRLVIAVKNANQFSLGLGGGGAASIIQLAVEALIRPEEQALQLVGAPIHGGPTFAAP